MPRPTAGDRAREPRAALCLVSRRGRAFPAGAAPPHHARLALWPPKPSVPALPQSSPGGCCSLYPDASALPLLRAACKCAASRGVTLRTRPAPRDCRLS
eukprot:scaffold18705_cov35-Phaeocystis_antarctica.AAC.4